MTAITEAKQNHLRHSFNIACAKGQEVLVKELPRVTQLATMYGSVFTAYVISGSALSHTPIAMAGLGSWLHSLWYPSGCNYTVDLSETPTINPNDPAERLFDRMMKDAPRATENWQPSGKLPKDKKQVEVTQAKQQGGNRYWASELNALDKAFKRGDMSPKEYKARRKAIEDSR